ncbi:Stress-induced-phosphoprotein 1 [Fasciolopsis buskii]|uniref:Stress-induced-phosphoprotein 1 n=1 Tax=Fasciolopsis buskii TaxID=27845 RepID=A0A8E0RWP5_9TREM|nr:Stress-induced-phosphoprotein 1 [Fasciolopsis buski]
MANPAALAEKDLGNAEYKRKNFQQALLHYDKAIELEPTCITYHTNKAAVYFEMGEYDKCIELCERAVEVGRENRAGYDAVAKAYTRAARCFEKKNDLINAKKYFEKSLSECRQPDIEKKVREITNKIKEAERLAYINPELAEEEKNKGNQCFQKGNYPDALKHYSEAIKRNPDDAKLYSNRAACYTKLMEFPSALKDCNTCIDLDPAFIKGYLRKGAACTAMKDLNQARKAYRKALEIDPECAEAKEGLLQTFSADDDPEAARKQAMNDPEVAAILSDPAMRLILNQMENPTALREHLNNPEIASKLMKLIDAGLISFR